MIGKIYRFISKLTGKNWKNSRGQGIIETQFVTIIFFTITFFGIMDMTRIIFLELKAFNASYMACRVAILGNSGGAQSTAEHMFGKERKPVAQPYWSGPDWSCNNGMGKCELGFFYIQNLMFPGLLQPIQDMTATRQSESKDSFIVNKGVGQSIFGYSGSGGGKNTYYYAWTSGGQAMTHPLVTKAAGFERMKMMGKPGGAGPFTY